jgi:hypothetical protein
MAQVIRFYVPDRFKPKVKSAAKEKHGKVIAFPSSLERPAECFPSLTSLGPLQALKYLDF